jgi:membrane fusion protein, epimerase transport system
MSLSAHGNAAPQGLSEVPRIPRSIVTSTVLGIGAILLAGGGFGYWATTVPLASAVVAQGHIVVASKRKDVQHLDGGLVRAIHVRDGDRVREGDILVELDPEKVRARYELNRFAYFSGLAQQARLRAEQDGAGTVDFSSALVTEARRAAQIDDIIDAQRALFAARLTQFQGEQQILQSKMAVLHERIAGLRSEEQSVARQLELAKAELEIAEVLFRGGNTNRLRVHNIRRECVQLEGSAGRVNASLNEARKEIVEHELSLAQLTVKRQTNAVTELKEVENKLLTYKETYLAAQAELDRLTIRAPVRGTVVASGVHTIGGVVKPGETILQVVPSGDSLVVEARIRPADIDDFHIDAEAEIKLTGFKQRTTPSVHGRLLTVSADAITDPRTNEAYYLANIGISEGELTRVGLEARLLPGMPVETMIKTGERTALAYLLQPIYDSIHRAWRED